MPRSTVRRARCDRFAKEHPDKPILLGVYEFSARGQRSRLPHGDGPGPARTPPRPERPSRRMAPDGGTPIGDAMIAAKQRPRRAPASPASTSWSSPTARTTRATPPATWSTPSRSCPGQTTAPRVYFIAFDVAAEKFKAVRDAGGLVLAAANEQELQQTLDYVLTGKILAEQPAVPGK